MTEGERGSRSTSGLFVDRTGTGSRSGAHIVLLHGFGATGFTWRHCIPDFAARAAVLNVDLKGFGRSAKPDDGRYSVRDLSDEIIELVDREKTERFVLVGHSLGGAVALLAALALRHRGPAPTGVVLISTPAFPQRVPPFVRLAQYPRAARLVIQLVGARAVVRAGIRSSVLEARSVDEAAVSAYAEAWSTPAGVRSALECARTIIPDDIESLISTYPQLDVPTLVLHGAQDRVVPPRCAQQLADALPDARLAWVERCGHVPHEERPDRVLAAIGSFLDESGLSSDASL